MDYEIRPAGSEDIEQLLELYDEEEYYHTPRQPWVFRREGGREGLETQLRLLLAGSDEGFAVLVADDGGRLAGFVAIGEREVPEYFSQKGGSYAYVGDICVRESYRGQGIGRDLMKSAHEWAALRGIRNIELTVWDFNGAARSLYKSLGYQTTTLRMWKEL